MILEGVEDTSKAAQREQNIKLFVIFTVITTLLNFMVIFTAVCTSFKLCKSPVHIFIYVKRRLYTNYYYKSTTKQEPYVKFLTYKGSRRPPTAAKDDAGIGEFVVERILPQRPL